MENLNDSLNYPNYHNKYLVTMLLQILYRMCQWKNFENRLIFGEDMHSEKVGRFLRHGVEELYYPTPLIDFSCRSLYIAFP